MDSYRGNSGCNWAEYLVSSDLSIQKENKMDSVSGQEFVHDELQCHFEIFQAETHNQFYKLFGR